MISASFTYDGGQCPLLPLEAHVSRDYGSHSISARFTYDGGHFSIHRYEAGIHWSGVGNEYSYNDVADGPHNCFLGGGNEAEATGGAVDCLFEGNTLDRCSYEAADTGAFYSCGQQASAFVNRNNTIRSCSFSRIRNIVGTGVQSASVQAVYLDDQMSGWTIEKSRFTDCQVGSFIGGGRRNVVRSNRFEHCDTAQHFDDRGETWESASCNCTGAKPCKPGAGACDCNLAGAAWYVSEAPAARTWASRFPELQSVGTDRRCQPAHNVIRDNVYCKSAKFLDMDAAKVEGYGTVVANNTEVTDC